MPWRVGGPLPSNRMVGGDPVLGMSDAIGGGTLYYSRSVVRRTMDPRNPEWLMQRGVDGCWMIQIVAGKW